MGGFIYVNKIILDTQLFTKKTTVLAWIYFSKGKGGWNFFMENIVSCSINFIAVYLRK
jgi:hypothetical protein